MPDEGNEKHTAFSADEAAMSKKLKPGFHGFLLWVAIYTILQPFCYLFAFLSF